MKRLLTAITLTSALALAACAENTESTGSAGSTDTSETQTATEAESADNGHGDHPADGGPAPAGIVEAENPTYPVGTKVILNADHMSGMEGAEATIAGAFDTTTYSVSYTPTDGGAPVTDHKWVVHEELEDPGEAPLAEGSTVVLNADHMSGMQGAEATIDSATEETVYMVDFSADGMEMTNHKWVVESEISPAD